MITVHCVRDIEWVRAGGEVATARLASKRHSMFEFPDGKMLKLNLEMKMPQCDG